MPAHSGHHKQERIVIKSTEGAFKRHHHESEREREEKRDLRKEFRMHLTSIAFFIIVAIIASFLAAQHFNPDLLGAVRDTCVAAAVGVLGDLFSRI